MGFVKCPPAVKRILGPPFLFQNFRFLDQQVKFERKSNISSISMELPDVAVKSETIQA